MQRLARPPSSQPSLCSSGPPAIAPHPRPEQSRSCGVHERAGKAVATSPCLISSWGFQTPIPALTSLQA